MRHALNALMALTAALFTVMVSFAEEKSAGIVTKMTALRAYEDGFAFDVMRALGDSGVRLNDMVLIEDDGPGAGVSGKGTYLEEIFRGILARKTVTLDDPTAEEAHVVLFMNPMNKDRSKQTPFLLILNGTRVMSGPSPGMRGTGIG